MGRRLPSLNALRAFEAAARLGGFVRAADELNVTHAAISRHVRELEAWLGRDLFVRTGRGVTLTSEGTRYAAALTPLFDGLALATEAVLNPPEETVLHVTCEEAFATWWLVPRLGRFNAAHPDVTIDLDPSDEMASFRGGGAPDIGIRYGPGGWTGTRAEPLVDILTFPVCNRRHLSEAGLVAPDDLVRSTLLHDESKRWWADWLVAAGADVVDPRLGPMFRRFLSLEAAATGQGCALADNVVAADGLIEGWLVKPFALLKPDEAYWIVLPGAGEPTAAAAAFEAWVRSEMAATQAALAPILATEGAMPAQTGTVASGSASGR